MEVYEDRVINGLLKSGLDLASPEQVQRLLDRDFDLVVDPERVEELWPCVWALASVLERQFSGTIYINGLDEPLPGPSNLGSRVLFNRPPATNAFAIGIGAQRTDRVTFLSGDVRGSQITYGHVAPLGDKAHPVACFALAGYIGYATLAKVVGLAPFHQAFTKDSLNLSLPTNSAQALPGFVTFIGLGQLGQAYIALLYFLDTSRRSTLDLLDKDFFELPNRTTQILLPEIVDWNGKPKAGYLASHLVSLGWTARGQRQTINWGWKKLDTHGSLALMGLDKFDPRRMTISAGYDWLFEAGVGTSFVAPKITWHSFPADPAFARLFPRDVDPRELPAPNTEFENKLQRNTKGGCGWVTYNNISASAPAMGVLASAYLWTEVLRYASGYSEPISGLARLWSPLLPYQRTRLSLTEND